MLGPDMGLFRRLFGPPAPPAPRMRDVLERLDTLEGDVAGFRKRLKSLTGMVTGAMRADPSHQDDPGPTNGEEPTSQYPPAPPIATAHLARRFRVGG